MTDTLVITVIQWGAFAGLLTFVVYIFGTRWLRKYATTTQDDYKRISIWHLVSYTAQPKECTISRRIKFFGSVYYLPIKGVLEVYLSEQQSQGMVTFTHPAFWFGSLTVYGDLEYLDSYGYLLSKDANVAESE